MKSKYCYDIEVYPNFFCITFKNIKTKEITVFIIFSDCQQESRSINQYNELVKFIEAHCQWLIGYNSASYDDNILLFLVYHFGKFRHATASLITSELKRFNDVIIAHQRFEKTPPEVYALQRYKKPWFMLDLILQFNPIDRTSLKQLAVNLRWPLIQDLPYKADHIVLVHEIDVIVKYNLNDVLITERVMYHLHEEINNRIDYTKKYGSNIINSCHSQIGKRIICDYYQKGTGIPYKDFAYKNTTYLKLPLKFCVPPKIHFETDNYNRALNKILECIIDPNKKDDKAKKQFEHILTSKYITHTMGLGGIHSNNQPQILEENELYYYIDIDVEGYYPRITINDRVYPNHMNSMIVDILDEKIVSERKRIKKSDPVLAYMLKIAANAFFGQTKSLHSPFYDPRMTTYICVGGQLYLLMLMEALELHSNCVVVYSNTDGLTVRVPRNEIHLFDRMCDRWQKYTGFVLEFVRYRKMIIRDISNFLMFSYDKEKPMKAKGAYVYDKDRKELKELAKGYTFPIVAKAVQEFYDKGTPIVDTVMKEQDIYEFMRSMKVSQEKFDVILDKGPNNVDHWQKTNRWIVTNGNPMEGRLFKVSKSKDDIQELQSNVLVTCVNDVHEQPITDYHLNYDFYIRAAQDLADLTKVLKVETLNKTEEEINRQLAKKRLDDLRKLRKHEAIKMQTKLFPDEGFARKISA